MELNRKVLVKVAALLFLLGITATVEARFDARSFIKEVLPNADAANYFVKSSPAGACICTAFSCICLAKDCHPPCSGSCYCKWDFFTHTFQCNTCADETMMFFPGAGAH